MIKLKRDIKLEPRRLVLKDSEHKIVRIGDDGIRIYYRIKFKDKLYWLNELDCEVLNESK